MNSVSPALAKKKMPARFDRVVPHQDFWRKFVAQTNIPDAGRRFFHVLRIGDTPQSADEAAGLILGGSKTANVGLKLDYDESGDALPEEGMLSIVEDGAGHPVAIVETTEVVVEKFCEVDDAFARCFGDWGGSLKSWRRQCRANYAARCRSLGQPFSEDTELILERFRVVFKPGASAAPRPGR